jgi:hypothetical protein
MVLRRLHQIEAENGQVMGYVRHFYSYFIIFYVLDYRGSLIF